MTSSTSYLIDGPGKAPLTVILAHGAGAPMDTPFMTAFASGLAAQGWRVLRFEFAYMARRRQDGRKAPPAPQARLLEEWRAVIETVAGAGKAGGLTPRNLVIGGKSLGGRMASLVADEAGVAGLVCLGYPFHPPGKPERLRTAHLADLKTPALFVQGTRDPFGGEAEVGAYDLARTIGFHWATDGDHGLKPRKSSGATESGNWDAAIGAMDGFLQGLAKP